MKIVAGDRADEFVLEFSSLTEFESFFEDADNKGYFLLQTERLPSNAVFRARCEDSPRTRRIRPAGITRMSFGYEVRLGGVAPQAQTQPETQTKPEVQAKPEPAAGSPLDAQLAEPAQSLNDKIRAMTVTERAALALKADLLERRILMQENNPKIHEFLLRNTRMTDQELAFLARNPAAPMQTILTIANRKEWMNREVIRSAILINPRTPSNITLDLLPLASAHDILKMFHSKNLRQDVNSAVRLEMKKRGIRPKKMAE